MLPLGKAAELAAVGETDLAHSVAGFGRFRVNVYRQRGSVSLAIRRVVPGAPAIAELGVPPVVATLAGHRDGLVVISGPFASGKTTTAAAMVDHINAAEARHIGSHRGSHRGPPRRPDGHREPAGGRRRHPRCG
ncbi:hypothetical protein BH20ACT3_BH20ACT3_13520 [soil metagenome]